jgi:hypothetical protein
MALFRSFCKEILQCYQHSHKCWQQIEKLRTAHCPLPRPFSCLWIPQTCHLLRVAMLIWLIPTKESLERMTILGPSKMAHSMRLSCCEHHIVPFLPAFLALGYLIHVVCLKCHINLADSGQGEPGEFHNGHALTPFGFLHRISCGRKGPTHIFCSPITYQQWGFIMESCWGVCVSFDLPPHQLMR